MKRADQGSPRFRIALSISYTTLRHHGQLCGKHIKRRENLFLAQSPPKNAPPHYPRLLYIFPSLLRRPIRHLRLRFRRAPRGHEHALFAFPDLFVFLDEGAATAEGRDQAVDAAVAADAVFVADGAPVDGLQDPLQGAALEGRVAHALFIRKEGIRERYVEGKGGGGERIVGEHTLPLQHEGLLSPSLLPWVCP